MFGFGRKKLNFEESVRKELDLRGGFAKSSIQVDIEKLDGFLENAKTKREFREIVFSRNFAPLLDKLEEYHDLDRDKIEEIVEDMIKERRHDLS